jgi:predicted LPLAT superfamily acyltransferase
MENNEKWQGKSYGGRFGHGCFIFLMRTFGLAPCYALLFFVAFYFAFFKRGVYSVSSSYLRRVLNPSRLAMPYHVYRHIYSFGKTIIDKWAFYYEIGGIRVDNSASDGIKSLIADGTGMIALNAHIGAWDISVNVLQQTYERDTFVLGMNTEDEDISEMLEKNRVREKVETLEADKLSVLSAYSLLKGGAIIAIQGDRIIGGGRRSLVNFFGVRVEMPLSAFALAKHAEVPVVQVHCVRTSSRNYRVVVFPPLNGGSQAEPAQLQAYAKNLEGLLKKYPYQWANFYDIFQTESAS